MKDQVITLMPDGSAQTTMKDSFFDTRFLGNRAVQRMTEILFDAEKQKFYIVWHSNISNAGMSRAICDAWLNELGSLILFDTYEFAVEYEIQTINKLRLEGWRL